MIFVIDLDHTVCFPNDKAEDAKSKYGCALPSWPMIIKIRKLKDAGHTIIFHTARRMVTHSGDVTKVKADVETITVEWLRKHNVPYNELIFGKPYGDYYVDDKGMNISDFLDCLDC